MFGLIFQLSQEDHCQKIQRLRILLKSDNFIYSKPLFVYLKQHQQQYLRKDLIQLFRK